MTKSGYRFMISGGGTGGHIFPALAIADELHRRFPGAEFLFVGARDRMEMKHVPRAGYAIAGLWISGIQRKLSLQNLLFPLKLLWSLIRCTLLIHRFKPQVVIGTGGFASGPLLFVASRQGIPCLIQEQNSYPGITNKLLGKKAQKICVAFPEMERFFPSSKLRLTGNPIRQKLQEKLPAQKEALAGFHLQNDRPTLLVLGGSLGARRINELISAVVPHLLQAQVNLIWQCGKLYYQELQKKHPELPADQVLLTDFLPNMEKAYAAASVVVSRAGAGTLSELAVVAKASVLIPSPNVAEDHQTKNARSLEKRGAALVFAEERSAEELLKILQELLSNEAEREKLAVAIAELALPRAAEHIVDEIQNLLPHG